MNMRLFVCFLVLTLLFKQQTGCKKKRNPVLRTQDVAISHLQDGNIDNPEDPGVNKEMCKSNPRGKPSHKASRLMEGDIAVQVLFNKRGNPEIAHDFVTVKDRIWVTGMIPYKFKERMFDFIMEPIFSDRAKKIIEDALQHITENVPCIMFSNETAKSESKLIFALMGDVDNPEGGCWSYVGKQKEDYGTMPVDGERGQVVNLGQGCLDIGTAIHEIMHSLGATHEQKNRNRDSTIKILWENIDPGYCSDFEMADSTFSNYSTAYDLDSIMQYQLKHGSRNGKDTMELIDKTKTIRPKSEMSITDIIVLGRVYEDFTAKSCFKMENVVKYLDLSRGLKVLADYGEVEENDGRPWPGGEIPYLYQEDERNGEWEPLFSNEDKQLIKSAMDQVSNDIPCISFREVGRDEIFQSKLIFTSMGDNGPNSWSNGCWAYVGNVRHVGGNMGQAVNLHPRCMTNGVIIHLIMHSLGAKHEHQSDSSYITKMILYKDRTRDMGQNISMLHDFSNDMNRANKLRLKKSRTKMSLSDMMDLGKVYQAHTEKSCFKLENVVKYMELNKGLLTVDTCLLYYKITLKSTGPARSLLQNGGSFYQVPGKISSGRPVWRNSQGKILKIEEGTADFGVFEDLNSTSPLIRRSGIDLQWKVMDDLEWIPDDTLVVETNY